MGQRRHKIILFLCTGNHYRSRFAEILFNSVAGRMGLPWKAFSRGLALERGVNNVGPMAVSAIKALESLGVRATEDVARIPAQVTLADLNQAERIVALKQAEHLPLLQERFPAWVEKIQIPEKDLRHQCSPDMRPAPYDGRRFGATVGRGLAACGASL